MILKSVIEKSFSDTSAYFFDRINQSSQKKLRPGRLDRQDIALLCKKDPVNPVILSKSMFHMSAASGQKNRQSNRKRNL
jgi:hypothetical protein